MKIKIIDAVYNGVVWPLAKLGGLCRIDLLRLRPGQHSLWQRGAWNAKSRQARRARQALARSGERRVILGLSAYYHDSAAALLVNGEIVAAAQEERFTRRKHDPGFPAHALNYCLREAGLSLGDVQLVVFYEDPWLKFVRLLKTFVGFAPQGRPLFRAALPVWLGGKLFQGRMIADALMAATGQPFDKRRLVFTRHHLSHAASAYFPSPFDEAAVLTIDGVGEEATTSIAIGEGDRLSLVEEIRFPHSLGLLYSAFTVYCGFKVNSGEYKLMGLAPYGKPLYSPLIKRHLIALKEDGSFQLNLDYFEYGRDLRTINSRFEQLMGGPARAPEDALEQRHMDIAASIQAVLEEAVFALARRAKAVTGKRVLCLAGGVALNCSANGRLHRSGLFEQIWIQPAAGDAGGALGASYVGEIVYGGNRRARGSGPDAMKGALLGPSFESEEIRRDLSQVGAVFEELPSEESLLETVSAALADGKAIGWFAGRMEFGPRALGGRSILADPRSSTMQRDLNLKIKNRESFRPFAPAVLQEDSEAWFELDTISPYMLLVTPVQSRHRVVLKEEDSARFGIDLLNVVRSTVPAITHVDMSARVQTVDSKVTPRFHRLIEKFKARSGVGMVVNTSFNVRGEPIVCTPADAFRCLMGTALDLLVVENFVVWKHAQDPALRKAYVHEFAPD